MGVAGGDAGVVAAAVGQHAPSRQRLFEAFAVGQRCRRGQCGHALRCAVGELCRVTAHIDVVDGVRVQYQRQRRCCDVRCSAAAGCAAGIHVFYPETAIGGLPAQFDAAVARLRHREAVGQRAAVDGRCQLQGRRAGGCAAVAEAVEVVGVVVGEGDCRRCRHRGARTLGEAGMAILHGPDAPDSGVVVGCQGHRRQLAGRYREAVDDGVAAAEGAQRCEASLATVGLKAHVHLAPGAGRCLHRVHRREAAPFAAL